MTKKIIKSLLLIAYVLPLVFTAMSLDFYSFSMTGHYLMLAVLVITALLVYLLQDPRWLLVGNLLSFISSLLWIIFSDLPADWQNYFKPLTPFQFLLLLSILNLLGQTLIYLLSQSLANKGKNR